MTRAERMTSLAARAMMPLGVARGILRAVGDKLTAAHLEDGVTHSAVMQMRNINSLTVPVGGKSNNGETAGSHK